MMERMSGERAGRQALTSVEGMGSRVQVGVLMPESDLQSSEGVIGENWVNDWSVSGRVTDCGLGVVEVEVASWLCIELILSWKNERKELHLSGVKE